MRLSVRSRGRRAVERGYQEFAEQLEPRQLLAVVFGPAPQISTVPAAYNHVIADFDGDGVQDLAALSATNDRQVIFARGRGDGSFEAAHTTTLNVRAWSIAAGQLVPGGGAELVVVGGSGVPVQYDPQRGGFRAMFVRTMAFSAGSGGLEVATILSVASPPEGDYRPSNPIIGEFTGGGDADVVFSPDASKGRLVVLRGSGGTLGLYQTIAAPAPAGMQNFVSRDWAGADLNGDGRADLVAFTTAGYVALFNSASGLSTTAQSLGLSSAFVWKFADVNGDGKTDAISMWTPPDQVLSLSPSRYTVVRVKPSVGDGTFGAIQTVSRVTTGGLFQPGTYPPSLYEDIRVGADIDGDGLGDIVFIRDSSIQDRSGQSVSQRVIGLTHAPGGGWNAPSNLLAPNDASGGLNQNFDVLIGNGSTFLADVTGDGRADLIDPSYSRVQVFAATV